jgi:hypothetical protein
MKLVPIIEPDNPCDPEDLMQGIVRLIEGSGLGPDMACAVLSKVLANLAVATRTSRDQFIARAMYCYDYESFSNPQPTEVH